MNMRDEIVRAIDDLRAPDSVPPVEEIARRIKSNTGEEFGIFLHLVVYEQIEHTLDQEGLND